MKYQFNTPLLLTSCFLIILVNNKSIAAPDAGSLLKQDEVVGGYDSNKYMSKRMYATARDGNSVPISIVYRKDLKEPEAQNLLLYGYGAYGNTIDPFFRSSRLSLLDRGFI